MNQLRGFRCLERGLSTFVAKFALILVSIDLSHHSYILTQQCENTSLRHKLRHIKTPHRNTTSFLYHTGIYKKLYIKYSKKSQHVEFWKCRNGNSKKTSHKIGEPTIWICICYRVLVCASDRIQFIFRRKILTGVFAFGFSFGVSMIRVGSKSNLSRQHFMVF